MTEQGEKCQWLLERCQNLAGETGLCPQHQEEYNNRRVEEMEDLELEALDMHPDDLLEYLP